MKSKLRSAWDDSKWEVIALENDHYYGSDFQRLPPICFSGGNIGSSSPGQQPKPIMANIFNWPPPVPTFRPPIFFALRVMFFITIAIGDWIYQPRKE